MSFEYLNHYTSNTQTDKIWLENETVFTTPNYYGSNSDDAIRNADRVLEGYTELFYTDRGTAGRRITYSGKAVRLEDERVILFIHIHGADNDNLSSYANRAIGTQINIDGVLTNPTISQFTNGTYNATTSIGIACYSGSVSPTDNKLGFSVSSTNYRYYYYNVLHVFIGDFSGSSLPVTFNTFHNNTSGFMNTPTIVNTSIQVPSNNAKINIKVDGVWKLGDLYIKKSGIWNKADKLYIKKNDTWIETEGN